MKLKLLFLVICLNGLLFISRSQDTFSIVAVDTVTGEVGSAGASCVDLIQAGILQAGFLGQLIPGVGAINTQAFYDPDNQNNATNRMNLGDTPDQIIQWLINNDVSAQPESRQYGIAAIINGSPETAAHTGVSNLNYKNHITGSNYSIQGNILLGQIVLDSMEARFLNEDGDLACKLMAALQGANMVGADSRCTENGTSSLFAFVKVAQPADAFGSPSFSVSVRTPDYAGIEPIDTLQTKFNLAHDCGNMNVEENNPFDSFFNIYPNPASDNLIIEHKFTTSSISYLELRSIDGSIVLKMNFNGTNTIDISSLTKGVYIVIINHENTKYYKRIVKK